MSTYIAEHGKITRGLQKDKRVQKAIHDTYGDDSAKILKEIDKGVCHGLSVYFHLMIQKHNGDVEKAGKAMRRNLATPQFYEWIRKWILKLIQELKGLSAKQEKQDKTAKLSVVNLQGSLGQESQTNIRMREHRATAQKSVTIGINNKEAFLANLGVVPEGAICYLSVAGHQMAIYKKDGQYSFFDANLGAIMDGTATEVFYYISEKYNNSEFINIEVLGNKELCDGFDFPKQPTAEDFPINKLFDSNSIIYILHQALRDTNSILFKAISSNIVMNKKALNSVATALEIDKDPDSTTAVKAFLERACKDEQPTQKFSSYVSEARSLIRKGHTLKGIMLDKAGKLYPTKERAILSVGQIIGADEDLLSIMAKNSELVAIATDHIKGFNDNFFILEQLIHESKHSQELRKHLPVFFASNPELLEELSFSDHLQLLTLALEANHEKAKSLVVNNITTIIKDEPRLLIDLLQAGIDKPEILPAISPIISDKLKDMGASKLTTDLISSLQGNGNSKQFQHVSEEIIKKDDALRAVATALGIDTDQDSTTAVKAFLERACKDEQPTQKFLSYAKEAQSLLSEGLPLRGTMLGNTDNLHPGAQRALLLSILQDRSLREFIGDGKDLLSIMAKNPKHVAIATSHIKGFNDNFFILEQLIRESKYSQGLSNLLPEIFTRYSELLEERDFSDLLQLLALALKANNEVLKIRIVKHITTDIKNWPIFLFDLLQAGIDKPEILRAISPIISDKLGDMGARKLTIDLISSLQGNGNSKQFQHVSEEIIKKDDALGAVATALGIDSDPNSTAAVKAFLERAYNDKQPTQKFLLYAKEAQSLRGKGLPLRDTMLDETGTLYSTKTRAILSVGKIIGADEDLLSIMTKNPELVAIATDHINDFNQVLYELEGASKETAKKAHYSNVKAAFTLYANLKARLPEGSEESIFYKSNNKLVRINFTKKLLTRLATQKEITPETLQRVREEIKQSRPPEAPSGPNAPKLP